MSSVVISGDTSGAITLAAPAVAGTNTITLPALTGTAVIAGQNSAITAGTSAATTSGTSVLIASAIPSWVKRVTVAFNNISTSATSNIVMQLGTGGTLTTTGYSGGMSSGTSVATTNSTYFSLIRNPAAGNLYSGAITLVTTGSNIWFSSGNITSNGSDATCVSSGLVTLAGTLERISLTTVAGTDTFDAGSVNILYE